MTGQATEIKDPLGICTRYEYDVLGRKSRIYNNDGMEVRYGYDALNRISRIHCGNGNCIAKTSIQTALSLKPLWEILR